MVNLGVSHQAEFCALIVSDPKDWGSLCVTHVWWKVRVVHSHLSNPTVCEWGSTIRNSNHGALRLAGIELIFFKAAPTVLRVGSVTQTLVITTNVLAIAEWHLQGVRACCVSHPAPPARMLEGAQEAGTADIHGRKGCSIAYAIVVSNKSWVKTGGRKGGMFGVVECVFLSNRYAG